MRYTWNRQQNEPEFQFNTPVPENHLTKNTFTEIGLEDSIGELEPQSIRKSQSY